MSEAQSLSYAKAQMANRLRIYQVLFRISIIANLLVGLWCIFDPVGFAQRVFQIDPYPQAWPGALWAQVVDRSSEEATASQRPRHRKVHAYVLGQIVFKDIYDNDNEQDARDITEHKKPE
jgi:hypothetical protein